eukprot:489539-Prorocentrum_lima.AAC.1
MLPHSVHVGVDHVQQGGSNGAMVSEGGLIQVVQTPPLTHVPKSSQLLVGGPTSPPTLREA